jgi:hypothetical protein
MTMADAGAGSWLSNTSVPTSMARFPAPGLVTMELNPIRQLLRDLGDRQQLLRGYL